MKEIRNRPEVKLALREKGKERMKDLNLVEKLRKGTIKKWQDPEYKERRRREAGKQLRERNIENWKKPKYREKMSKVLSEFNKKKVGEKNNSSKLTNKKVLKMRKLFNKGVRIVDLIKQFNVSKSTVRRVIYCYSWKHI